MPQRTAGAQATARRGRRPCARACASKAVRRAKAGRLSWRAPCAAQVLSPEEAAAEDRLREELEIRKAQLAVAASLEAKDSEAKLKLANLTRTLKVRGRGGVCRAVYGPHTHARTCPHARTRTRARAQGKDYTYDHQGRILPLTAFNPDASSQLQAGADFRLQSPQSKHKDGHGPPAKPAAKKRACVHMPVCARTPACGAVHARMCMLVAAARQ